MPRITVCSGSNYCGSCIRCLLLEVEGREKRLREEIFNPQEVSSMSESSVREKEIPMAMERLENGLGKLDERIDMLEESLTQVLCPEDSSGKTSVREKQNTYLGDRLHTLAAQVQDVNDRLSDIISRLEV